MISVPEVLKSIIDQRPYLADYIEEGVVNLSSLARLLLPEIEEKTMKDVTVGSITVALKRFQEELMEKERITEEDLHKPDIIVRSNLCEVTVSNSPRVAAKLNDILAHTVDKQYLFIVTQGNFETTIVASKELEDKINEVITDEVIVSKISQLAAITLKYPTEIITQPGVYYRILRPLALGGVSITEVASTFSELTIILEQSQVEEAFRIINSSIKNYK